MKGQFYIMGAFMIALMIASVAALYYPLHHRTQRRIEQTLSTENIILEAQKEITYITMMDPQNHTRISEFREMLEYHAQTKGTLLEIQTSTGPKTEECTANRGCPPEECANQTTHALTLTEKGKLLRRTANICW